MTTIKFVLISRADYVETGRRKFFRNIEEMLPSAVYKMRPSAVNKKRCSGVDQGCRRKLVIDVDKV